MGRRELARRALPPGESAPMAETTPATSTPSTGTSMQRYLDKAVKTLQDFNIVRREDTGNELIRMLDEVKHLDEPKVLAISKTIAYMSTFNQLVRENVENINVGTRYLDIAQMFDSIREDSKTLINQLQDGKISMTEKMQNLWMRLRRGTPSKRFDDISQVYKGVAADTKDQLDREKKIMDAYIDFRFALKEAEVLSREILEKQMPMLEAARAGLGTAQEKVTSFTGPDAEKGKLELERDQARHQFEVEDRNYQLLKDITENLSVGYDVGETLITKLQQTHDVKDRVYRRSVTFFTTNEHVFTVLGTVYTSQYGLHEATQAQEAMKEGVNKGLEDVAELGRELERAAIKAGYGTTINPASVEKLVQAISDYQVESLTMIAELRKESEASAREIRRVVEDGKKKFQATLVKFALEGSSASA